MLCDVCRKGLEGIWDASCTRRVCPITDFADFDSPADSKFVVTVETYKTVRPHDLDLRSPEHHMFGHHVDQASFEQSVRDGCVMCDSLGWDFDGRSAAPNPRLTALGYYSLFSVEFQQTPIMHIYAGDSRAGFALDPYMLKHDNINLDISPSTGDDVAWAMAQGWLDTCLGHHHRCNERSEPAFVPSRLVHLDSASGREPTFQVVEAAEVQTGTRYLTLNHCFAAQDGLELTERTRTQLSAPQPFSVLPLTLRHALSVVSRLGLSHLWFDRLCIVQDSLSDQQSEAGKAHDLFRNAFLSIAASASASSSSGIFRHRERALVAPTVVDFPLDADGTTVPHMSSLEGSHGWRRAFSDDPLPRCAEAIQGRLLAPRVLHFGRRMIFWECHDASCAEIHPHGVPDAPSGRDMGQAPRPWKTLLDAPASGKHGDPVSRIFGDWFSLLHVFSASTPKAPEEKLPGLVGIAQEMQRLLREQGFHETTYLAGMWKAMLRGGLLWNVRQSGSRPSVYRAPSWSWAAVDGPVNFHNWTPDEAGKRPWCELVDASTTADSIRQTGQITGGSIVLRGKLALGKLHRPRDGQVLIKALLDVHGGRTLIASESTATPENTIEWTVSFDTEEDVRCEILCLPIQSQIMEDIGCHVHGLALTRLEDGCYVRLGKWGILLNAEEEAHGLFRSLLEGEVDII